MYTCMIIQIIRTVNIDSLKQIYPLNHSNENKLIRPDLVTSDRPSLTILLLYPYAWITYFVNAAAWTIRTVLSVSFCVTTTGYSSSGSSIKGGGPGI